MNIFDRLTVLWLTLDTVSYSGFFISYKIFCAPKHNLTMLKSWSCPFWLHLISGYCLCTGEHYREVTDWATGRGKLDVTAHRNPDGMLLPLRPSTSSGFHCDQNHWWKMLSATYSFSAQPPYVSTFCHCMIWLLLYSQDRQADGIHRNFLDWTVL